MLLSIFCFTSRKRITSGALVTGFQTCALPISPALVIILPADLDDAPEWLRVTGDAIVARGRGEDWGTPPDDPGAILLVAPAAAITLHRTALPDLAARQAVAAARLLALESSLGGAEALHVATGPRDPDGGLAGALVRKDRKSVWWGKRGGVRVNYGGR